MITYTRTTTLSVDAQVPMRTLSVAPHYPPAPIPEQLKNEENPNVVFYKKRLVLAVTILILFEIEILI